MIQDPSAIPPYPRGDVRAGAGVLTRFVERRLAGRYGWNLEVFQGREAVFPGSRTGGFYRVVNPGRYFLRPSAAIEALQIAEWLRFGNSIRQLTHVFALAERYGVRRVRLPGRHLFYQGERAGDVTLRWAGGRRAFDLALSGYFLHMRALMPPLDPGTEHRIVERYVRPMVAPDLLRADPRVGADDLVMHFRGGDAFDRVEIKPGYWQPPLAYYLAAFEHARARRVWLVFEDRQNPTIAGAEEALRLRGVEVIVQSGLLIDDLRVLLSARRLVASVGTFVPAAALLSPRLTAFYQFGRHPNPLLELKGIEVLRAYDVKGQFMETVAANWGARPKELEMMMSYPTDWIGIEEGSLGKPAQPLAAGCKIQAMAKEIRQSDALTDEEKQRLFGWGEDIFDVADLHLTWRSKVLHFLLYAEGELVSHVGILKHVVSVDGEPVTVGGIGGVVTVPAAQGKGYARRLMGHVAEIFEREWKVDAGLLFCLPKMVPYYEALDWRKVEGPVLIEQPEGTVVSPMEVMVLPFGEKGWPSGPSRSIELRSLPW